MEYAPVLKLKNIVTTEPEFMCGHVVYHYFDKHFLVCIRLIPTRRMYRLLGDITNTCIFGMYVSWATCSMQ